MEIASADLTEIGNIMVLAPVDELLESVPVTLQRRVCDLVATAIKIHLHPCFWVERVEVVRHVVSPFEDFREALEFTYEIGELADKEWHEPDIQLQWGEVRIEM